MPEKEILGQGVVELVLDQSKYQADLKRLMSGGGGKGVAAGGASSGRTFIAAFSKVAIVGASKAGTHAGAAFAAAFNKKANANIKIKAPAVSGGGGKPSAFSGAMNAVKKMFGSMGGGSVVGIKSGASVAAGEAIIGAFSKVGKAMFGVRAASAATSSRVVRDMKMQEVQSHRLSRGVDGLGGSFKRTQQSGLGFGGMMAAVAGGNILANMVSSVTQRFKSFLSVGWQTSAMMETMSISFEKMVGNKSEADKLLATLKDFADVSPLEFPDVMKAATGLMATQAVVKDQLLPTIKKLTDAAAGSTEGFESFPRVVRAITQMLGKGKIQAEEMLQMAEAGIPAWDALANAMGMSIAEVQQLGQDGKLGTAEIMKLIDGMGKKFEGLAEKQSKTWPGMLSTLRDATKTIGKEIVAPFYELGKVNLSNLLAWLKTDKAKAFVKTIVSGVSVVAKLVETALNSKIFKTTVLAGGLAVAFTAVAVAVTTVWGFLGPVVLAVGALAGAATVLGVTFAKALSSPEGKELRKVLGEIKDLGMEIGSNVFKMITGGTEDASDATKKWADRFTWVATKIRDVLSIVALMTTSWDKALEHIGASVVIGVLNMNNSFQTFIENMVEGAAEGAKAVIDKFAEMGKAMAEVLEKTPGGKKLAESLGAASERAQQAAGNEVSDISAKNKIDQAARKKTIDLFEQVRRAAEDELIKKRQQPRGRLLDESGSDGKGESGGAGSGVSGSGSGSGSGTGSSEGSGSGFGTTTVEGLHAELQKRLMDANNPGVVEAKKHTSILETIATNTGKPVGTDGASEKPMKAAMAAATPAAKSATAKATTSGMLGGKLGDAGARQADGAVRKGPLTTAFETAVEKATPEKKDKLAREGYQRTKSEEFEIPDFNLSDELKKQLSEAGSDTVEGKNEHFVDEERNARIAAGYKDRNGNRFGKFFANDPNSINSLEAITPLEKHQKEKRASAERSRERIAARKSDFANLKSPEVMAQNEATKKFKERRFDRGMENASKSLASRGRIDARKASEAAKPRVDLPHSPFGDRPISAEVQARIDEKKKARQAVIDTAISDREKARIATQQKIAAKTRSREGGTPFVEERSLSRFEQGKANLREQFEAGKQSKKEAFQSRKEQLRAAFDARHDKGGQLIDKLKPGAAAEPADPMMAVQQQQLAEMKLANTKNDLLVGAVKTVGEQVAASGGYAK